jgi:Arc-like DNA binding domain
MSRDITPFGLRMPAELKARVDAAAVKNGRSINAEVIARLQESFEAQPGVKAAPVGQLLEEVVERLGARVQIIIAPEEAAKAGIGNDDEKEDS